MTSGDYRVERPHFNDEPIFELGTGARLIRLQNMIYDNQGADKPGERMLVGSYPERIPNIIPSGSLASSRCCL